MRKSIFFCEISHLGRVAEGEFDDVFAALRRLGIEGFQFSDSDIERAGEERLLAALARHRMRAEIIHTVIVRDLEELGILAVVILIRALLAIIIHWEIRMEQRAEQISADIEEK